MKWGRKKTPFSSSSYSYSPSPPCSKPSSLISHVFPVSWLSKFKHKSSSGNSEPRPRKGNSKAGKLNCSPSFMINSPRCGAGTTNGTNYDQFYGLAADDDAFWRLSFRQDNAEEKKKRAGVKSVWYDPDDDELGVPVSSCPNCRRKEAQKLNGVKNCKREKERDSISTRGTRSGKERKTRGELCNGEKRSTRSVGEKEERASETRRKCRYVSPVGARNPSLKTIEEEGLNSEHGQNHPKENAGFAWKVLKETKMEEVKSRNETQRKSLYVSREQQHGKGTKKINKVRAYSPRTASRLETCKVKAIEDMKKAKLKMKKEEEAKERRRVEESKTGLDSFAVAKCSYDPQQDFKDSMLEMIVEKKMSKPEELEELLACYLTLNSDQYHDMIIKVFKQVWSELHQAYFSSKLQNEWILNTN